MTPATYEHLSGPTAVAPKSPAATAADVTAPGVADATTTPTELRPVSNAEVAAYAKPKCRTCWGKGVITGMTAEGPFRRVCGCAISQFEKKQDMTKIVRDPRTDTWYHLP